jgi:hypothetical protein
LVSWPWPCIFYFVGTSFDDAFQGLVGYETFSFLLALWLKLLPAPREEFEASVDAFGVAAASAPKSSTATLSFIQVCRNYLRFPVDSLIQDQSFLQYLYMARCTLYTYPRCPGVDILASIRIESKGKKDQYRPLLISVITEDDFEPTKQTGAIDAMKTQNMPKPEDGYLSSLNTLRKKKMQAKNSCASIHNVTEQTQSQSVATSITCTTVDSIHHHGRSSKCWNHLLYRLV